MTLAEVYAQPNETADRLFEAGRGGEGTGGNAKDDRRLAEKNLILICEAHPSGDELAVELSPVLAAEVFELGALRIYGDAGVMPRDARVIDARGQLVPSPQKILAHRQEDVAVQVHEAAGTRGRAMLQGAQEIKIHGEWIPVRAAVEELSMLSAHADSNELMRWLSGFRRPPSRVFIVHGEDEGSEALRVRIDRELGWNAVVPRQNQAFKL